jgi:Tol biopolymer transport system component
MDLSGPYLGQELPGMVPQMFVPEELQSNSEWWWHGALAFTPDGEEFYLDIYVPVNNTGIQIRFMEMINNVWTSPQPPSFTGSAIDASPSFTDNGNKVFFISTRPNGSAYGVWTSTRTPNGWSVPSPINIPYTSSLQRGWRVSATTDETLYLRMRDNTINTDMDIYLVRNINGVYSAPERLDDNINSSYMDLGAFIDPEENYIIFASDRPGGYGGTDLYISSKETDGSWKAAINMGEPVNSSAWEGSPFVSADGLYLFFNSDRHQQYDHNPYWVNAQVIYDLITDVEDEDSNPVDFYLSQNYPNPFNPNATINFFIPKKAFVSLKIYDVLGTEITSLFNEEKSTGSYEVKFNASGLTSGIYFYHLQAGNFIETKKMILLK